MWSYLFTCQAFLACDIVTKHLPTLIDQRDIGLGHTLNIGKCLVYTQALHVEIFLVLLQVMVGQNLDFNVGTVTYTSDSTSSESDLPIIVGATASGGVVIILLLIMCFIICCFSRRARAKDRQFSNLLVQMEQWEVEMADECKRGKYTCS